VSFLIVNRQSKIVNRKSFDVIVIGSGPAGCAAAATCLSAGLKVLMVTDHAGGSRSEPDTISPLESIHPGVSSLLKKIGAAGAEVSATRALYSGIYAGRNYTPLGEDENGPWQGMHINRDVFDTQLIAAIERAGVMVQCNAKVESLLIEDNRVVGIKTTSAEILASYIVDASGKKGFAGKQLNFKRRFFSPLLHCWTGVSAFEGTFPLDAKAAHFIPGVDGWTWLAPQPPDHCAWTRLSLKSEKSLAPPEVLKDGTVVGKVQFANMRWRMFRPVCTEGVVLCGDAAGILDPAAGQGIFNALWSGIEAANAVVRCLQQPDFESVHLAHYDDWFVQQFEMKVGKLKAYYEEQSIHVFR
jgi:flavin-dependent dehydrogenase